MSRLTSSRSRVRLNISEEQSRQVRKNLGGLAEWNAWDYWPEEPGALLGYGEMGGPEPEQDLDWIARHVWRVTEDYRPILLSVRPGTPEVKVYGANEEVYREYLDWR